MNKKTAPELFEKRTGVKYQNWIQAWAVTLKQEKRDRMMKYAIQFMLWSTCIICLYNILITKSGLVFSLSGFIGMFSTWILIRWDNIVD